MATRPPADTPFGLEPNVAAGLAYLLGIVGGIIMLVGGGTNRFVKWAAAQSTTMWGLYIAIWIVFDVAISLVHVLAFLYILAVPVLGLIWLVLWLWTFIMAFQGKEVEVPIIAGITRSIFKNVDTVGVGSPPPSI